MFAMCNYEMFLFTPGCVKYCWSGECHQPRESRSII